MTTLDSSLNGEVQKLNVEATDANPQNEVVPKKDYIELQSVYTATRQAQIETSIELARNNPKAILDMKDTKLQEKVIKSIYGLDTLAELQMINGTDFWKTKDEAEEGELDVLKKKVALMEHRSKSGEVENAIERYMILNKELFTSPESEVKLRESLGLLSSSIDINERIRLAWKLALGVDSSDENSLRAFKELSSSQWKEGASANIDVKTTKENSITERQNALKQFLAGK